MSQPPLTPHRSLSSVGFVVLMSIIAIVSFAGGLVFYVVGAWPVGGFFGLDAVLIYWAFRVNYRAAEAYEQVTVTPSELRVRKVTHKGKVSEWSLNPLWTRLDRETHTEFGPMGRFLVAHCRRVAPARIPSPVPPVGGARAEGVPAGDHARQCAQAVARFRERARRDLRGRPLRPGPAARPVRHPRGDVAGRMEVGRRRADDLVRLPRLAVR